MHSILPRLLLMVALLLGASAWGQQSGAPVKLSLGKNYREIAQQPLTDPARIEVVDFFFYGCPFCNELRPMLESWRKALPADVVFRRTPTVRHDSWAPLARTYYTLEALGQTERLIQTFSRLYHLSNVARV